jgi:hypothetical protein
LPIPKSAADSSENRVMPTLQRSIMAGIVCK